MEDECLFTDPNMEKFHDILNPNQEDEPPLFLDFPSPFFDDISTNPTHSNDNNHQHHITSPNKPRNITDLPSDSRRIQKRNVGKKDRHSKIHTAQGLRDRRMRLSLQIARKFFDLQDLLGFDKASNTIEWLFCKSNKAIKEVAESFSSQNTNQSMSEENCDVGLTSEIKNVTNNHENSKEEEIKNTRSRKRIQDNSTLRETRDQARARARDRTRERLMIKELEKSKLLFGGNPNQEFHKLGLGHIASPNHHNAEELGFITSSPSEPIQQESSCSSLEHSITHRLLREQQSSATINPNSFENCSVSNVGTSTYCSTLMNPNPPAGWLNSCDGFLDGEWNTDSLVTEFYNNGIVPTTVSLTGDIYEQNPSSFHMSSITNNLQYEH